MVLEATMLVLDNSEWMRNGDYTPTRWEAQSDAVNIVFDAKTNSHPESEVGILTMAGKSPEVLSTLTKDMGKVVSAMHQTKINGNSDIITGINVAQLALKHRQNKNQRQRIVVFIGSPVTDTEEGLVKLAKRLKKNNVAVDIVSFGEDQENEAKLGAFVDNVKSGENSHLLTIPAGPQLLSDIILSSPILMEEGGGAGPSGGEGGAGGNNFEFGVDPSMDPELAMALRMSLEEEQARQRTTEGGSASAAPELSTVAESTGGEAAASVPATAAASESTPAASMTTAPEVEPAPGGSLPSTGSLVLPGADPLAGTGTAANDDSEDAMLRHALALSQESSGGEGPSGGDEDTEMGEGGGGDNNEDDENINEEEAIARAIEMSLKGSGEQGSDKK